MVFVPWKPWRPTSAAQAPSSLHTSLKEQHISQARACSCPPHFSQNMFGVFFSTVSAVFFLYFPLQFLSVQFSHNFLTFDQKELWKSTSLQTLHKAWREMLPTQISPCIQITRWMFFMQSQSWAATVKLAAQAVRKNKDLCIFIYTTWNNTYF